MTDSQDALLEEVRAALESFEPTLGNRPRYWLAELLALVHVLRAERDALRTAGQNLVTAYDDCDGNRGAFSCHPEHDCRCPKDRSLDGKGWKGKWRCECGREALDAALNVLRGLTAPPSDPT